MSNMISEKQADNFEQIMADCDSVITAINNLIENNTTYLQFSIKNDSGDGHDIAIEAREKIEELRRLARKKLAKLDPERAEAANNR